MKVLPSYLYNPKKELDNLQLCFVYVAGFVSCSFLTAAGDRLLVIFMMPFVDNAAFT